MSLMWHIVFWVGNTFPVFNAVLLVWVVLLLQRQQRTLDRIASGQSAAADLRRFVDSQTPRGKP